MEIIYNQIFYKLSETRWCYWRQAARAANHASSWCLHCCRALGINFYNSCLWEWYVKAVGYRKWHIPGYLYGDKKRCCRRIWLKYKRQSASDPGSWHFWASASARGDCRGCKRGEHNWPSKFILWCVTGGWIYLCFLLASVLHSRNMSSNQVSFYFYLPNSGWSRCLCVRRWVDSPTLPSAGGLHFWRFGSLNLCYFDFEFDFIVICILIRRKYYCINFLST